MKYACYISLLVSMMPLSVNSQQVEAGLQTGIGTFSMTELKRLNEIVMQDIPFDTRIVTDFPVYFYYRPFIMLKVNNISIGPMYTYQSTGSRVSAKDYSGEYRFDIIINSSSPGILAETGLFNPGKIQCSFYSAFGILFSNLKLKEHLKVQEENLLDYFFRYKTLNMFFEPGLKFTYPLNFLNIGLNAGYLIQVGNKSFHAPGNKDALLVNPESEVPVKPGWNGVRVGLSVYRCFNLTSKKPAGN